MPRASRCIDSDPYVVDLLISGAPVVGRVSNADTREVIRILVGRGYTDGQIAHVVGRPRRSVQRTRSAMGIGAAVPRHAPTNNRHLIVDAPTRPRERG